MRCNLGPQCRAPNFREQKCAQVGGTIVDAAHEAARPLSILNAGQNGQLAPVRSALARKPPATLAFNRSKCEAILPIDLAPKLVSFGNAARLGRGVSPCSVHFL